MKRMLGFFFAVVLMVLVFLTIYIQDWHPFAKPMHLAVHFDKVEGLREGDDVRVEGIVYGKVKELDLDRKRGGVIVSLELDRPVNLYEGYEITVEAFSILGGNFVTITRGIPGTLEISTEQTLIGRTKPSAFDVLASVVSENREVLANGLASFGSAMDEVRKVAAAINQGEGTVGLLVKERRLYDEVVATVDEAKTAVTQLRDIVGGLGQKLDRTDTTLGRLLNTSELHDELMKTMGQLQAAVADAANEIRGATRGEGPLGALVNDKEMADNLRHTAANLKKISQDFASVTDRVAKGEGTLGKLVTEDKLYQDAERTLQGVDKILGRAGRSKLFVTAETKNYPESEVLVSKLGLRIEPDETKYFYAGASFLSLDKDGPIRFERQIQENENDTIASFDALAFYRVPWFLTDNLGLKAGMIEGKPAVGVEVDFEAFADYPVHLDFEIRDAYNDLDDEDIDEEIGGPMTRLWLKLPLWPGQAEPDPNGQIARPREWWERFLHAFKVFGGVNRLQDNPEFFVGFGLEYRDEDIKTLVGLLSAGR
ncbi:MAG: MCE family protein [Planctomycetes bacterium]|nr:MCE family protein [Planctomycetota bacterium]